MFNTNFSAARVALVLLVLVASAKAEQPTAEPLGASHEVVRIYLDASQSGGAKAAGVSIERGVRAALHQLGDKIGDRSVELVVRDHRASTPRSRHHLEEFARDPQALAVIGGMHSPPILALRDYINKTEIPLLVPWAAAGPITRGQAPLNWIFRLSVDDTKAGYAITRSAIVEEGFRRPFLFLEQTGWGDSNLKTMTKAIGETSGVLAGVARFGWGSDVVTAGELIEDALAAEADVVFLVGNTEEGLSFAEAMLALPENKRLPIRSHWGILGGNFYDALGADRIAQLDLQMIQTRFTFVTSDSAAANTALEAASALFPEIATDPARMPAAVGFIHAYDLTLILAEAAAKISWNEDIRENRRQLRTALEGIEGPIEGLVKTYRRPFAPFDAESPDAHEALDVSDLRMGHFNEDGVIELWNPESSLPASRNP